MLTADPFPNIEEYLTAQTIPKRRKQQARLNAAFHMPGATADEPLFDGAKLTKREAVGLAGRYMIGSEQSKADKDRLLKLLHAFLPPGSSFPPSIYKFTQILEADEATVYRFDLCTRCRALFTTTNAVVCECGEPRFSGSSAVGFFRPTHVKFLSGHRST